MKFVWLIFVVAARFIKENLCVPAIRPLSQRGIIFPVDNWDDCFLDEASTKRGSCKRLEECPEVLNKWERENIYPKSCYFIKQQQFVCCPIAATKDILTITKNPDTPTMMPGNILLDIFNTDPLAFTEKQENFYEAASTKRPSNIFLDNIKNSTTTSTKRPSNIFFENIKDTTTTSTKRPSNIFLDNIKTTATTSTTRPSNIFLNNLNTDKTTTKKPSIIIPDIFYTEKPQYVKRRSEIECELQNRNNYETIDTNGPPSELNEFPFMTVLGWKSNSDNKIWYPCGGILISTRFVLTSAHCAEIGGQNPSFVHLGDKNFTNSEADSIKIKQFIIYPGYNVTTIYNDIALVELEQNVNNPTACLWTQHDLPINRLTALGFNIFDSNRLFKTSLIALKRTECQEYFKLDEKLSNLNIVDSHLCAGDVENVANSCQGDTGGPLIMEFDNVVYVVGITSLGLGCADLPPSIYTRVSSFIDWIEPILWPQIDVRIDRK